MNHDLFILHDGETMINKEFEEAQNFNIYCSPVPNCRGGSNSRDGLVKFVKILKGHGLFLGQAFIKMKPMKVKWVVKFVPKHNLTYPYN